MFKAKKEEEKKQIDLTINIKQLKKDRILQNQNQTDHLP